MRYEMIIQGMATEQCQGRVIAALQAVFGVLAAEVNLAQGTAWIDAIEGVTAETLRDAVEDWGYQVVRIDRKQKNVLPK